jgi:hypothetical protein
VSHSDIVCSFCDPLKSHGSFTGHSTTWKSFNQSQDAIADGLSAGKDAEGNDVYIGRGTVDGWLTPGKLVLKDSGTEKAGVHVELGLEDNLITSDFEYYAKNQNCNYSWVPSDYGWAVANAVETITRDLLYYVGRAFQHGSVQVGKVFLYKGMFYAFNGTGHEAKPYEVLICERKKLNCGQNFN